MLAKIAIKRGFFPHLTYAKEWDVFLVGLFNWKTSSQNREKINTETDGMDVQIFGLIQQTHEKKRLNLLNDIVCENV